MSAAPRYATGKHALGICDRCGWQYKLHELHYEIFDQRRNGLRVCMSCLDKDHPQLRLGEIYISDPQALFDPRPDTTEIGSTQLFGWRPVGNPLTNTVRVELGTVTVVTS